MADRWILLVEDRDDDAALTLRAFRKSEIGTPLRIAPDGADAIAQLFGGEGEPAPSGLPALVLLDLALPKVDGFEVLRRIRSDDRTRLLPVVVLTSSVEPSDLIAAYRLGANSYVRKPVEFDAFQDAARQLGRYWLELNEAPPA
jgi:two-component system response regulator